MKPPIAGTMDEAKVLKYGYAADDGNPGTLKIGTVFFQVSQEIWFR